MISLAGLENLNDFPGEISGVAVACRYGFFYNAPIPGFDKVLKSGSKFWKKFLYQPILKGDIETQGGRLAIAYQMAQRSVVGCVRQKILDGPDKQFNG